MPVAASGLAVLCCARTTRYLERAAENAAFLDLVNNRPMSQVIPLDKGAFLKSLRQIEWLIIAQGSSLIDMILNLASSTNVVLTMITGWR